MRKERGKEAMKQGAFCLKVLGARGSMPISGREYSVFGGSTSCYLVEVGRERIFLDAGTGLVHGPDDQPEPPTILLSHLHLDHVLGLGVYPRLLRKGCVTRLLVPAEGNTDPQDALNAVFSPPCWPLRLGEYAGQLQIEKQAFPARIGEVRVDGIAGNHPGGCTAFRLDYGGRSLAYVTDHEPEPVADQALIRLAKGVDLLLCDAQYTLEQYANRRGFGHSATEHALEMMHRSGAKRMLLIHHDPSSTDEVLLEREKRLGRSDVRYAREGETIEL